MKTRKMLRISRQRRIRAVIIGSARRPRLSIYRSDRALFAQIIDDGTGKTLVSKRSAGKNITAATALGKEIAGLAARHKIGSVVFDRGGNRYHGVIKSFADAARAGGLKF